MAIRQPTAEAADETEPKAPDVEIPCDGDCDLRILKGTIVVTVIFLRELRSL